MEEQKKEYKKDVGAIWNKISVNNKPYKTISLDLDELRNQGVDLKEAKINLNIFRNYYKKEGDNQPDYRVYKKERKEYNVGSEKEDKFDKWVKKDTDPKQQELEEVEDTGIPF